MTPEEIIRGNKLIATKILGFKIVSYSNGQAYNYPEPLNGYSDLVLLSIHARDTRSSLKFHCSWDWIMFVVRIINTYGYDMEKTKLVKNIYMACGMAELNVVFKRVVEFASNLKEPLL